MKVAQLLYSGLGGHGSVVFSLLNADKQGRWQPLLGFLGIEPLSPTYAQVCEAQSIPYEYFAATAGQPWKTWPAIVRWLKSCQPNAIFLHSVTALLPCLWYGIYHKVPVIVVEHQCNALKRRIEWVYSHLAMLLAARVVVLTPAYRDELKQRLGIFYRDGKVQVIPNGIDTSRFTPEVRLSPLNRTIRLGMASRFTKIKRHDILVEMISELRQRRPEIDWKLSLAGDGESWSGVRQMVQAQCLEGFISLPGQLDEQELIYWYQSLDIYVHASEGETLSTSLLQAMASALPIVASDVSGINNLIAGDIVCGILVLKQDSQGFADAVIQLTNEPGIAAELSRNGRKLVEVSYNSDRMFSYYMKLLNKHA